MSEKSERRVPRFFVKGGPTSQSENNLTTFDMGRVIVPPVVRMSTTRTLVSIP